jgi:class 3 adenylate cyclase/tetratricopeptide (TPR) repeat protein
MGRTATVTVLMNDIVGSTALRVGLGDDRADELFGDLVGRWRTCLLEHEGQEIKGMGDGLMAIFRSAADAVSCGVAMQQSVCVVSRERGDATVEMRVGLSAGEAAEEEGDWHGTPVVEAARLCAAATAGQVLVADVVRALVGSRGDHRFGDGISFDLKGLPEPVLAFSVLWEPPALTATASLPASLELAGRGVFVGRVAALAAFDDATATASSEGRQVLLLSGEPGQGKTRLAAEMARRAAGLGARVLFGRCDEDLQRAYRPWAEVAASLIAGLHDDDLDRHIEVFDAALGRLGPELHRRCPAAPATSVLEAAAEPYVLADALVDVMARGAGDAPTVIVLDDLHWADRPTLLLLKALLEVTAAVSLVILGTYRDTDLDRTHPLSSLLGDLRRQSGVQRLALDGLDVREVADFVDALAGQEIAASASDLVQALHAETNGNPLFLGEVLRYFVETGALVQRDGEWQRGAAADLEVPEGLKEVVGRRLDRLPQLANEALQVAAVVGSSFDLAIVEDVLDAEPEALIEAIELAVLSGIVDERSKGGDRFQFRHAVLRRVVEDELSSVRRALLHRKVGDALERRYVGVVDDHLDELAFHRAEAARAGDANEAARWCLRAATRALDDARSADAIVAAGRGWQVLELADAPDIELRCDLAIAGQWAGFWHDRALAAAWHPRAVADARALGDATRLARAACWILPAIDQMDALLAEQSDALASLPGGDPELRRLLLGCYVVCLTNSGAPIDQTDPLSLEEVTLAREIGDDTVLFDALQDRLQMLMGEPLLEERRALWAEHALLRGRGLYSYMSPAQHGVPVAMSAGDRASIEEQVRERGDDAARRHSVFGVSQGRQWDATLALLDGRFADVEALSALQVDAHGDPNFLLSHFGQLIAHRMQTGRGEEFLGALDGAIADHPNLPVLWVTKAWIYAAIGQLGAAAEIIDALAPGRFAALGRGLLWPSCMAQLTEAVAEVGAADHARTLYDLLEPWTGQCIVVGQGLDVPGAADRYLGMLAATLGEIDAADAHYAAALDLEERLQSPPLMARTCYWWARALLARGRGDDLERAVTLLESCVATADSLGMSMLANDARRRLSGL